MEKAPIVVDADDLENAVFGVAQEIADKTPGLSVRNKMRLTLDISDQIMLAVHSITETGRRSAAGKKAAETRYNKPKPGPAIPLTQAEAVQSMRQGPASAPFQATRESLAAKVDTRENAQHMGTIAATGATTAGPTPPLEPVPQTVVLPIAPPPAPTAAPIPAVVQKRERKPQPTPQAAPGAPTPGNFLQQPDIEPPPHPALLPGTTPFGSAPQ